MKSEKSLLVLDLDGTITKSDNLVQFSLFMIKVKKHWKFLLFYPLVASLKLKVIDNRQFKILYAKWIFKDLDVQKLQSCAEEFLEAPDFKTSINKDVLNFIQNCNGHKKIILSANYCFLVNPISKKLNISENVCINLETKNNKYTGKTIGIIPFGIEKIEAIKPILKRINNHKTIGLGDSKSDLQLLKFLKEGYLVKFNKENSTTEFQEV